MEARTTTRKGSNQPNTSNKLGVVEDAHVEEADVDTVLMRIAIIAVGMGIMQEIADPQGR